MPTVNSSFPTNLFVPAPRPSLGELVVEAVGLRLEQRVQALVIAVENDRTILEIGPQRYQVPGQSSLQVGEKLNLQVQQVEPQLEFKVLDSRVNNRMAQTLPLLTQPFDWGKLVAQLQLAVDAGRLPQTMAPVLNQLGEILNFSAVPQGVQDSLTQVVTQLRYLFDSDVAAADLLPPPLAAVAPTALQPDRPLDANELSAAVAALVKDLQRQVAPGSPRATAHPLKGLTAEIKTLLALSSSDQVGSHLKNLLSPLLERVQQTPDLSPHLTTAVKQLIARINSENIRDITNLEGAAAPSAAIPREPATLPPASSEGLGWTQFVAEVQGLVTQVAQLHENGTPISPELLGRLEGLQRRLLQAGEIAQLPVDIGAVLAQITPVMALRPAVLPGEQLGLLLQLFGFRFEAKLLEGKDKTALASLKLCLLELQKNQEAEDVDDPLRRLELFQLCRAKLAADQVQFIPLPFSQLEEGYLLAEKQPEADGDAGDSNPSLQMSLSLRLSALGNVRVDMLYEPDGLHLRLAGEDRQKMGYLQSCAAELREALQAVKLQGVSFSADARLPAQQLRERVLPVSFNLLNTRV